ncbi:MAG: acyltransferase, partial [Opitutales bacterium]|nr:acyltransferase [Opitutales bacterium]
MKRNTCICLGAALALLLALSFCNSGISIFVRTDAPADTEVKFEYKTVFGSFSKTGKTNADRQAFFQISYAPQICGFRVSVAGRGAPQNIYFFGKMDGEIAVENNVWNDHKIKGKTRVNYVIMIFCITACAYMVMKYKSSQRSCEALPNSGKIEYLDIVRITALFLILYAHLSSVACFAPSIPDIFSPSCRLPVLDASKTKLYTVDTHFNHFQTAAGQIGVVLFLLISAYLTNISRAKYDNREFLKRRVIRLWPGLIVALTAVALLVHYLGGVEISGWQYVSNLFLLNPFLGYAPIEGVVWVLVIEVLFYLIMALAKPFNFKKALA